MHESEAKIQELMSSDRMRRSKEQLKKRSQAEGQVDGKTKEPKVFKRR
jgi:hypothetical protein